MLYIALFSGCDKDKSGPMSPETPEPDMPEEVLPIPGYSFKSLTFPNEGAEFACTIHGLNEYSWSAESTDEWCVVSTDKNVVRISVASNINKPGRYTKIKIIGQDRRELGAISVNQLAVAPSESLEESSGSKHSYLPIFTATWCPYCPHLEQIMAELQNRWDYPILPMYIHVADSQLYTPLADELSRLYANTSLPTGYFENYYMIGNVEGDAAADYIWNLMLNKKHEMDEGPCSSIKCKARMTNDTVEAEVTVRPVKSGQYRLAVFILEDNIIKPQMTESNQRIPDYRHDAVLVGALTPVAGEEFESGLSPTTFSLADKIPSNVNLSNMRLLVVLLRNEPLYNYSQDCWYADNCISVPLGKSCGNGAIENIHVGEEIEH